MESAASTVAPAAELEAGVRELSHVALEDFGGERIDEARLNDRQRLAVVFQAAALLAHCELGGLFVPAGWKGARVTPGGLLKVPGVRHGRSAELPQAALRRLLQRLFRSDGEVKGRGEGRRIARHLHARWRQTLAPATCDREVAEILEAAPFLWQPAFADARTALVAEHRIESRCRLWLAGPGRARRRFVRPGSDRARAEELLRSPRARDLWEAWEEGSDPRQLTDQRRWQEAVAAWRRDPPREPADVRRYAQSLFALGKYARALEVLRRKMSFEARKTRAWCQLLLGERNAARATVRALAGRELSKAQTIELAEVAIRLHADKGQRAEIRQWIERALAGARGRARLRARIVAAFAAWDLEDAEAMDRHLDASRAALAVPELAWKWHHARALRALLANDSLRALEQVETAFKLARRILDRGEAGRLWNDVAVARAYADDLPGAERACLHSLRLLRECEGPIVVVLAEYNLAETRLRRGRTAGVESALEVSTEANRRNDNLRSSVRDLELWVRLELVQGRAVAALSRCAEVRRRIAERHLGDRKSVFEIFAARAQGWLGRTEHARSHLERATLGRVGAPPLGELEVEERPAVWALAGELEKALEEAAGTRWADLWAALAAGTHPRAETWNLLRTLEPFRAARLVFDCELCRPGTVPPSWVRRAITTLRRTGAESLAEKLENHALSPWKAIEKYLGQAVIDSRATAELLTAAGYGSARLIWASRDQERVVIAGSGGREELCAPLEGGRWVLRAPVADRVLRALFAMIRRHLTPPEMAAEVRRRSRPHGIVGESAVLRRALDRVDQLAPGELPILVLGESGTGKELVARQVHRASRRSSGPFLAVNCATFTENLIQSDLFGHTRGSFTGADRERTGVFESARRGTVFLDEVGDLPLAVQGQLLRVLQEGEIRRVGESFHRKVDVRVVAATHRDLQRMVAEQTFRQDLFYRLKVATVELPPLRARGDDVLMLAEHFLGLSRGATTSYRLTEDARKKLLAYPWPGNVRELRNVLEVAAALAPEGEICSGHLELPETAAESRSDYHQQVDSYKKHLLESALIDARGNRSAAARQLGMTRQALSYLVRQLGLRDDKS